MKTALVTGITGQDGSYLTELLLAEGYTVHGIKRRSSSLNTSRLDHIFGHDRLHLHYGDMTDSSSLARLIGKIAPDEIYNLAAMSHVGVSFELPEYSAEVNALGTLRLLEAVRTLRLDTKIYNASTSELFGLVQSEVQSEGTHFYPRSPYAVSKLYAHWICVNYREAYGMFVCNGILFNHESPRRGETFVTSKVVNALTRGVTVKLGNLNAKRDWGHAKDYVRAQWLMLQQAKPNDYVVATGIQYSVRHLVETVSDLLGNTVVWIGEGADEVGVDQMGRVIVQVDPEYFRPTEVDSLIGDSSLIRRELGWSPRISFREMMKEMVDACI